MIHLETFISSYITHRNKSMFSEDIIRNDEALSQNLFGKTILVIGGAGTIGSSFIKAILNYKPITLVVVDINENGLTELTRDLRNSINLNIPSDYVTYPMSYADGVFEKMFLNRGGFDIVANFSAHKHVRSEKDQYSIEALLRNNVLNAKKLLELLSRYPPLHYFCVSTDKAANPVNIMGASKKIMEEMIMSYSSKFPITTARFANVAFSNGSLPLGFLDRISKLQPISAPSDVTRYFVSPQESGEICMLACILGNSSEIFFPKLQQKQVMTFSSIAISLLKEFGYEIIACSSENEALLEAEKLKKGDNKYPVYFSLSDTTGEKPYEEFYTQSEIVDLTRFSSLGVVTNITPKSIHEIEQFLDELSLILNNSETSKIEIVNTIKKFIPNFLHEEKGKFLDDKM